jgi:hypothetical protein
LPDTLLDFLTGEFTTFKVFFRQLVTGFSSSFDKFFTILFGLCDQVFRNIRLFECQPQISFIQ